VDVKIARTSTTIKTMLENLGINDDDDEVVPLPNVGSKTLKRIINWAIRHKNDPSPKEEDPNEEPVSRENRMPFYESGDEADTAPHKIDSWDNRFLKLDQSALFELMLAANYLDIKGLLELTCKYVANIIKGKTSEELRTQFNITNDFTPSEQEQMQKESQWPENPPYLNKKDYYR